MKLEKFNHILTGFGSNILGNILMFATTIFLTRVYDPAVYGEFRLIFSFIALAVILLLLGRDNGIIYFSQHEDESKDKIIQEEIYFGFIVLLIGTLTIYLFSSKIIKIFLNEETTLKYFQISLVMIPLWGFFNLTLAGLKSKGLINYTFVLSNLTQRALRVPFFILFALISTSYYSLALSMIFSQMILVYLALKKLPFLYNIKNVDFKNFFKRFKYAIQLGMNAIIVVLLTKIDVIMVGKYTDNIQVAIYDVCIMLAFVVMLPFVALVKSSEPVMKGLLTDKKIQAKYKKDLKLSILLSMGIVIFYLITSKYVLSIFGDIYIQGSLTLIALSIGYMFSVALGTPIEILNMNGFAKISTYILLFSIFLNIVLNMILIPKYGILGAGIATGVSLVVSKTISMFILLKLYKGK